LIREAFANVQRFPMPRKFFTSYDGAFAKLQPNSSSYLVIVTRGHKEDMRVLAWAVRTAARYVGNDRHRRKVLSVYKAFEKEGYHHGRILSALCTEWGFDHRRASHPT